MQTIHRFFWAKFQGAIGLITIIIFSLLTLALHFFEKYQSFIKQSPGEYSGFQVMGMMEGVWGGFGKIIWQVFFLCGLIQRGSFGGIQNNLKIHGGANILGQHSSG